MIQQFSRNELIYLFLRLSYLNIYTNQIEVLASDSKSCGSHAFFFSANVITLGDNREWSCTWDVFAA